MDNPVQAASQVVADVATVHASKYLQQLCKHFAHKRPVTFDAVSGQIGFSLGECRLEANDTRLRLILSASDEAHMEQLKDVVARHLVRFAFRETLQFDWHPF